MPAAPTRKPVPQKEAATNIDLRGPLRSTQVPMKAAESPSITMAMEKITPIAVCETPKWPMSADLYTLVA